MMRFLLKGEHPPLRTSEPTGPSSNRHSEFRLAGLPVENSKFRGRPTLRLETNDEGQCLSRHVSSS
jgi:hypothetical protein